MNSVHVAIGATSSYALPLSVLLSSLLSHFGNRYGLKVYLIHRDLPTGLLQRLARDLDVQPVKPPDLALPPGCRYPLEAFAPVLLDLALPLEVERVLFLDTDLLILDNLELLWDEPLHGHCLGAVQDQAFSNSYFNAGVLLLDLAQARENQLLSLAARQAAQFRFVHQDALNRLVGSNWRRLPERWNVIAGLAGRFRPAVEQPAIVHFAGRGKPWRSRLWGPHAERYRQALATNPFWREPAPLDWRDTLFGLYDRYLRRWLYGLEHRLWRQGCIG